MHTTLQPDRSHLDCADCGHYPHKDPGACRDCTNEQERTGTWLPLFFERNPVSPENQAAWERLQAAERAYAGAAPKPAEAPTADGTKFDDGKPDLSLLPPEALLAIAEVLTFGAQKYAPHNWRKGFRWTRLFASLMRHLFAWLRGEDLDRETGLSHLAHAGANVLFLLTLVLTKAGTDDRFKGTA
jgi:hypothetical protein